MSMMDIFKGLSGGEIEKLFQGLDDAFDAYFSEHGERRRFMEACRSLSYEDISIIQSTMTGDDISDTYERLASKLEEPIRSADAILMLETDLEKTKDTNYLLFLLSIVRRDKVLKALNRARFLDWENPLLENINLPKDFIDFLWQSNKNDRYKDIERYETLRIFAKHPNCPLNVLKDLYHFYEDSEYDDDPVIRSAISRHRNIDDEFINLFINSNRKPERVELIKSKYIPQEALLSLMKDSYDEICNRAKKQFSKRFPDLTITNELIDDAIAKRVINPYKKPKAPKRKFNKYEDVHMGLVHIQSLTPSQRASVIGLVDEEILLELLDETNKTVKRSIALHRFTPEEKLSEYFEDKDLVVASNAFQTFCRKYPDIAFEDVFAPECIDATYELLNKYLNDKKSFKSDYDKIKAVEEAEQQRVYLLAQYSSNDFIQMKIINDLEEIPYSGSIRWILLSCLVKNKSLCDNAAWKVYMELEFGGDQALQHCKSKPLFEKIIASNKQPSRNFNPTIVQSLYQSLIDRQKDA